MEFRKINQKRQKEEIRKRDEWERHAKKIKLEQVSPEDAAIEQISQPSDSTRSKKRNREDFEADQSLIICEYR